jgi:hypothetical protein
MSLIGVVTVTVASREWDTDGRVSCCCDGILPPRRLDPYYRRYYAC